MKNTLNKALSTIAIITLLLQYTLANNWRNLSNYTDITQVTIHNNTVWVAAKGGLMKYDQLSGAKTFFSKSPGQLPSLSVERVLPNMITGDIWIGTYDNGIARFNGSTWQSYPYPDAGTLLYEMKMAPNGTIWCATTRGIYKFENGIYTTYLPNGSSSASAAWDIELLPGGRLLCAGNKPFIYTPATNQIKEIPTSTFAYGHSTVFVQNDSTYYFGSDHGDMAKFIDTVEIDTVHTPGIVKDMQQDANGNLMILMEDNNLYNLYSGHTFVITDMPGNTTAFTIAGNGDVWESAVVTEEVKLIHKNPQFALETISLKTSELKSNWVRKVKRSLDGNILVISDYGIQKYDIIQNAFTDEWVIVNQPNIEDVVEANGKLYAGSSLGYLSIYENNQWTQVGNGVLPSPNVDHVDVDATGNIWLAGPGYVAKYDGSNFTVFNQANTPLITTNLYIRDIHCDRSRNVVWAASYNGLLKYANGTWTIHTDQNTPGIEQYYDAINCISEDVVHNMYFGTIYGAMLKYDGLNFNTMILPEHVGNQSVNDIAFTGNTMYVGDNLHGVWVYENNQWDSLNTRNSALTSDYISSMAVDANNNLWIGNLTYGLDVYNKNSVVLSADETQPTIEAVVFPNPSTSVFNVKLKNADEMDITVSNLSGQTIKHIKANANAVIDLSNNPKGLYIANITTKAGTKNIKLSFH